MPTEPVTIRPATRADLPELGGLLAELFSLEPDFTIDAAAQRRGLALLLDEPRARLLAAECEGRVVGMCSGQLVISTSEGGPAILVEDVVVAKTCRGRGIGAALLAELRNWALARGAARLQLLADRTNTPALDFYRRLGWETTQLICLRKREA